MVSRVTSALLYRQLVSGVGRIERRLADAQADVVSQRRLREASDDPAGASRAARLHSEQSDVASVRRVIGFAQEVVARQDVSIDQAQLLLARAREIAALAANGTTTPASRQQAAVEVAEIERGLVALANTEVSGRYVFAGLTSGDPPFAGPDDPGFDPDAPYSGPDDPFLVRTGGQSTLALTTPGGQVFGAAIAAIDELRASLEAGEAPAASLDAIEAADAVLRAERTIVGGRARGLTDRDGELRTVQLDLEARIGAIEGADLTESISRLIQLQTALQATLEAGRSLQSSLLDSVRL
jgi:flagellar hook-associated protein 3 FlgL